MLFTQSRNRFLTATTVALSALTLTVSSVLAETGSLTVHNKTKIAMTSLYISTVNSNNWGKNILNSNVLKGGESRLIQFNQKPEVCLYDIKAKFIHGQIVENYEVNLCDVSSYTFKN